MALQLGDEAPNFTAETTEGTIDFHEYLGDGWGVLFSHPKDFTPVCTTELGTVAKLKSEFDKRNTKVIAVSVDPLDSHKGWVPDINETQGTTVNFPIIADPDRKVADLYGMIHPNASDTITVRSVFVIGPDKKVKLTLTYPASTGRNFQEILGSSTRSSSPPSTRWRPPPTGRTARTSSSSPRSATTTPRRVSRRASRPSARTCASRPSPTSSSPTGSDPAPPRVRTGASARSDHAERSDRRRGPHRRRAPARKAVGVAPGRPGRGDPPVARGAQRPGPRRSSTT